MHRSPLFVAIALVLGVTACGDEAPSTGSYGSASTRRGADGDGEESSESGCSYSLPGSIKSVAMKKGASIIHVAFGTEMAQSAEEENTFGTVRTRLFFTIDPDLPPFGTGDSSYDNPAKVLERVKAGSYKLEALAGKRSDDERGITVTMTLFEGEYDGGTVMDAVSGSFTIDKIDNKTMVGTMKNVVLKEQGLSSSDGYTAGGCTTRIEKVTFTLPVTAKDYVSQ